MRLSALQRANAAKNARKAKKAVAEKREAAEREMDWDAVIARFKAMFERIEQIEAQSLREPSGVQPHAVSGVSPAEADSAPGMTS